MRVVVFVDRYGVAEIVRACIEPDSRLLYINQLKLFYAKQWLKGKW